MNIHIHILKTIISFPMMYNLQMTEKLDFFVSGPGWLAKGPMEHETVGKLLK